jgi:hypothetical protein
MTGENSSMPTTIIPRGSSAKVTLILGSGGSGPSTDPGNRWYVEFTSAANNGASDNGWRMSWAPVLPHAPAGSPVETTVEVPFNALPGGNNCTIISLNVGDFIDIYKGSFTVAGGPPQGPGRPICLGGAGAGGATGGSSGGGIGGLAGGGTPNPGSSGGLSIRG